MASDTPGKALYSIGQFAKLTAFPVKTLRYYDEEDVLKPAFVDPETGYRSYTETQRQQMLLLAELHFMQVPVEMLRDFMRNPTLEHQAALYDWKIGQLELTIHEHSQNLRSLRRKRATPWRGQQYEVSVEDQLSRPWVSLYYVATIRDFEEARERAFDTVRTYLTRHGVTPASPPITLSLPTKDQRSILSGVEVYAGFEVTEPVPAEGNVQVGMTPAGQWYGAKHTGPYEHIWHVMTMLLDRMQRDGRRVQRVGGEFLQQEVFHVGPWDTPDAGQWVTDVRWLVRQDDAGSVVPRAPQNSSQPPKRATTGASSLKT